MPFDVGTRAGSADGLVTTCDGGFDPADRAAAAGDALANAGNAPPRARKPAALEAARSRAGDPWTWYAFGPGSIAPAFHESSAVAFSPLVPDPAGSGAAGILRRLAAEHEAAPPLGWDALVERVRRARQEEGELAMARAADAIVNEAPYIDNTGGVYFSPKRFLARGGAVCKDYANVKYLLLRDAGFPIERMRIAALGPSAHSSYPEGHVVLLVKIEGASEPWALDLAPFGAFAKDLKDSGETMAGRVARIRREGLADHEPRLSLSNMAPLSRFGLTAFGSNRPFLEASNELGSRFFAASRPALAPENMIWMSADGGIKAFKAGGQVWVQALTTQGAAAFPVFKKMGAAQAERERLMVERSRGLAPDETPARSAG